MDLRRDDYPPRLSFVQELYGCNVYRDENTGVHWMVLPSRFGEAPCNMMRVAEGSPFPYSPEDQQHRNHITILEDLDMTRLQRKQRRREIIAFIAPILLGLILAIVDYVTSVRLLEGLLC